MTFPGPLIRSSLVGLLVEQILDCPKAVFPRQAERNNLRQATGSVDKKQAGAVINGVSHIVGALSVQLDLYVIGVGDGVDLVLRAGQAYQPFVIPRDVLSQPFDHIALGIDRDKYRRYFICPCTECFKNAGDFRQGYRANIRTGGVAEKKQCDLAACGCQRKGLTVVIGEFEVTADQGFGPRKT